MKTIAAIIVGISLSQNFIAEASRRDTTVYETKRNTVDVSCTSRRIDVNGVFVTKKSPKKLVKKAAKSVVRVSKKGTKKLKKFGKKLKKFRF